MNEECPDQSLLRRVLDLKRQLARWLKEDDAAIPGVSCYFGADGVAYVDILGVQFSFHAIPRTKRISDYIASGQNSSQPWSGIRLQPIAPLVLEWASALALNKAKAWTGA